MTDWKPTDAQVEAARNARTAVLRSIDAKPFAQQTPEYVDGVNNAAMRAALIAATRGYSVVTTADLEWVASELDGVSETFSARAVRSCAKDIRDLISPQEEPE